MKSGTRLDHYEILDKIGEGGMGAVYRARDTSLDREVAVKVLPPTFSADAGRVARFEREAKVVAALSHPNIVTMYGFGTAQGVTYAAMELLQGRTLREHLVEGPLPLRKAVDVARQIAAGLDAAHARGIVHRDLKPENVFITPDGRARILDFGLAGTDAGNDRDSSDSGTPTRLTDPGTVVGTAGYMSPEQARGSGTDAATDIFALGVMLQEMLSGEHPFHRETTAETLTAILREDPPELRVGERPSPPALARIVRRCLEKAPGERFRNAVDLAFALEGAVVDSGASQPAMTAVEVASPGVRRPLPLVAALVLAATTFAAGWWLRPTPPLAGPPVVRELTFTGEDTQPDVSPDGRLIAFTSQRNGISQIWLRQVEGGGEQPLTEGPDWRPSFSPDSQSVAFVRADGDRYSAFRVPVVGGQPRKLIEDVKEVAWSPDERQLAFVRGSAGTDGDTTVGLLDVETGQERILATRGGWELFGLAWSADSQRLAMVKASVQGGSGNWRLMIVDAGSGAIEEIDVGDNSLISNPNWEGGEALIFARSETTVTGTPRPSAIVRYDLQTGQELPLFWEPYLFPLRGSFTQTTRMSLLGDDRMVFDTLRQVQSLWEVDRAAGTLRPIRPGVSMDRQPAYSPDGSRLVFTSNRTGNVDLFAYEFATDRLLQITDHPASDWDGGYTPDGRAVLFSSDRSGNLEIWMVDADGSNPRQVTNTGSNAENPTMTADGEWIVYSSGDPAEPGIYKIRSDGTDATLLASGALSNPEVSHDGRYALYLAGDEAKQRTQLRAVDVATGATTAFISETAWEPGSANVTYNRSRWMAGDEAVAFLGLDERGRPAIWVQDFDPDRDTTATRRRLTDVEVAGVTESFGISPDGNRVVIAVVRNLNILKMAENLSPLR